MKNKKKIEKLIGIFTIITVVGFGTSAWADQSTTGPRYNQGMQGRQMGPDNQRWGHRGSNRNDWSRGGQANRSNIRTEDRQKMQRVNPNAGRGYMRGGGMMGSGGSRGMMGPNGGQGMMGSGGNNRW